MDLTKATNWWHNIVTTDDIPTNAQLALMHLIAASNRQTWPPAVRITSKKLAQAMNIDKRTADKTLDWLVSNAYIEQKDDKRYAIHFWHLDNKSRSDADGDSPKTNITNKQTDDDRQSSTPLSDLVLKYGTAVVQYAYDEAKARNKQYDLKYITAICEKAGVVQNEIERERNSSAGTN